MTKGEITEAVARDLWQARQARLPAYVRDENWTWERALALSKEFSDMGPAQDVLDALEDAQAALSAISQAGYVVVPVEATPLMIGVGWSAINDGRKWPPRVGAGPALVECYRAMVATGRVDGGVDAQEDS